MCKSCNYPALRGEVRVNYTPVGQAESMRRQVELFACLCNRGECEEWQTAAFTEVHRQEGAIAQFTLFSNKLQEPIVLSDTHDQWHNVSQTLKRSCGAVCTPIERCASSVSFTVLHSPPKYVNTLAIKGFLFQIYTWASWKILYLEKQGFIHVWLSLGSRSMYICFNSECNSDLTCFTLACLMKSWPLLYAEWMETQWFFLFCFALTYCNL